ncbi:MAG: hypothetical protein AAGD04_12185 [Pseudomonadota bacterium]
MKKLTNYLQHIDFDLIETQVALKQLEPLHRAAERNWTESIAIRIQAEKDEVHHREVFRDCNTAKSKLLQRKGELEGERFGTGEDEEQWHDQ